MTEMPSFLSFAGPVPKLKFMQPSPMAETSRPVLPSLRFFITTPYIFGEPTLVHYSDVGCGSRASRGFENFMTSLARSIAFRCTKQAFHLFAFALLINLGFLAAPTICTWRHSVCRRRQSEAPRFARM